MTASSAILKVNPKFPVDPTTIEVLKTIDETLHAAQIPYMLVGATARDLILHHVHGLKIARATYDLDFGVMVGSWEQFERAKQLLLQVPRFEDKGREAHRLYYTPQSTRFETMVDIIPFGALETDGGMIRWPDGADTIMNVVAFHDVFRDLKSVQIASNLIIPTTSLPGLMLLKLFAWLDRRNDRDASDILRLLETYEGIGNEDRLHDDETEELERLDYDMQLAGAFLLGKDARNLASAKTRDLLSTGLRDDRRKQLVDASSRVRSTFDDRTERVTELYEAFFRGLNI